MPHFTDGETEPQKEEAPSIRSVAKPEPKGQSGLQLQSGVWGMGCERGGCQCLPGSLSALLRTCPARSHQGPASFPLLLPPELSRALS